MSLPETKPNFLIKSNGVSCDKILTFNLNGYYYQYMTNYDDLYKNNKLVSGSYFINKNDMMCVNFISMDQNVHFAVSCLKTDIFAEVEEQLYKQYPQYRETNNSFLAHGSQVLRFKTIAENKIGNGLPVTLVVPS